MVGVEIGVGSLRKEEFQTDGNNERLRKELDVGFLDFNLNHSYFEDNNHLL